HPHGPRVGPQPLHALAQRDGRADGSGARRPGAGGVCAEAGTEDELHPRVDRVYRFFFIWASATTDAARMSLSPSSQRPWRVPTAAGVAAMRSASTAARRTLVDLRPKSLPDGCANRINACTAAGLPM